MRVHAAAGVLLLAGVLACQSDQDPLPAADCLVRASAFNGQVIPDSYLVTYTPEPTGSPTASGRVSALRDVDQLLDRHNLPTADPELLLTGEQTAFLAHLTPAEAAELRQDPAVALVEPDRRVSLCSCVDVQTASTLSWNVSATGFGRGDRQSTKTAWVLDTGIDLDHPDLNVDEQRSLSFLSGANSADDDNGHGTHVAGIIGAINNSIGVTGVASGATLVALKVLDSEGEGKLSTIVEAVGYVSRVGKAGDVINISIGGEGFSPTLERVVLAAANKGILFAIAAGNERKDAADSSPANINHPNVFTVSAMDRNLNFASFSNFGKDIDACAYGVRIQSTYRNAGYATLSGTSMAAPHVAGLLLIRGRAIPTRGVVNNDPDGTPDPIARE